MAARAYSITSGQSQAASATKTNFVITAPSTMLVRFRRIRISQNTHKTSEQYELAGQRASAAGTSTAVTGANTPRNEAGAPNPSSTIGINHSVEPTYTANTKNFDVSWNSLTGKDIVFPIGDEIYVAPSGIYGIFVTTPSGTTTMTPTQETFFEELG